MAKGPILRVIGRARVVAQCRSPTKSNPVVVDSRSPPVHEALMTSSDDELTVSTAKPSIQISESARRDCSKSAFRCRAYGRL
jgi:hypothetical protein